VDPVKEPAHPERLSDSEGPGVETNQRVPTPYRTKARKEGTVWAFREPFYIATRGQIARRKEIPTEARCPVSDVAESDGRLEPLPNRREAA